MTKIRWLILINLVLAVVCLYGVVVPLVVLWLNVPQTIADAPDDPTAEPPIALDTPKIASVVTATRTPTRTPTKRPTTVPPTTTRVLAPTATRTPTPTLTPIPQPTTPRFAPESFAGLAVNPRARLVSQSTFFTSACYGDNINLLQDRDYMTPSDWGGTADTKCLFGFALHPTSRLPTGRYSAGGGPDDQPRFYLIPGGTFAKDQRSIKALSQFHVIVDPAIGCDALGTLGITADGVSYQCSACAFLRDGGICPTSDGSRSIVLPSNRNNRLNVQATGGTYGFLGFPAVLFRKDFSFFVTGRAGYPPPRMYFESQVDTFLPNVTLETTAEMTPQEVQSIATEFDRLLAGKNPVSQITPLERLAQPGTPAQITLRSKEQGAWTFFATPGTVLSSIVWKIKPLSNVSSNQFLETNLCLTLNGEETCFTGVEDFAHCAYYTPCVTGYSRLNPNASGGYTATRYFPAGLAPLIGNGKVSLRVQSPDIGAVLEMEIEVRVRDVDESLTR